MNGYCVKIPFRYNGYCVKIKFLGTNEQVLPKNKKMNRYCVNINLLGTMGIASK